MITLKNVSKSFKLTRKLKNEMALNTKSNNFQAVNNVSIQCEPGKIFGLLGPNGAGKTTLLRMIATMLKPTEGTITVGGYDVARNPGRVRKILGFLTGNTGLYDRLTAEEMVKYYADLYGLDHATYIRRRDRLFDMLDMKDFAGRRNGKLSTGMKQKVSIACTMINNPDIVVFDEPTSGLDVMTSQAIIKLIRLCKAENKTVIFSTHRMGEVQQLCDDLAIIHKGNIFYNGTYNNFSENMKTDSLEDEFIRITGETV